jgi:hypothetical protein
MRNLLKSREVASKAPLPISDPAQVAPSVWNDACLTWGPHPQRISLLTCDLVVILLCPDFFIRIEQF